MFEKVNPMHPDKIADRIAGAIVDLAYTKNENPKVAVEVLIGHGNCHIINETSEKFNQEEIEKIVHRISRDSSIKVDYKEYKQDAILAINGDYYGVQENGYVLRNGVIYRENAVKNKQDLVIYKDGTFEIIDEEKNSIIEEYFR